jgi:hypothetical protein
MQRRCSVERCGADGENKRRRARAARVFSTGERRCELLSCQVNAADFPAAPLQTVPGPHRSATKGSVVAAAGSRPGSRFVRSATKRPCPLPGTAAHGSAQASRRLRCACRRTDTRAQLMWLASVNVPRRHVVAPRRRSRAPCQPHVPNQDPHGTTRPSTTRPNLPA